MEERDAGPWRWSSINALMCSPDSRRSFRLMARYMLTTREPPPHTYSTKSCSEIRTNHLCLSSVCQRGTRWVCKRMRVSEEHTGVCWDLYSFVRYSIRAYFLMFVWLLKCTFWSHMHVFIFIKALIQNQPATCCLCKQFTRIWSRYYFYQKWKTKKERRLSHLFTLYSVLHVR